jgi:TRAP-type uncharacterized transport system fused permease subunit
VSALLGLFAMAVVFEGHHLKALGWLERLFFLGAMVLLLWPSLVLHGIGLVLFGALYLWQKMFRSVPSMPAKEVNQSSSA